jgi:hypothetical protein
MIVRTVDMMLQVKDLPAAFDSIGNLARQLGGWEVRSSRKEEHRGSISIRVPADKVDQAVAQLRGLAAEVKSEVSSSQDVTDEYVDNQSRLRNLRATEQQLIKLLERTGKVEDLLQVQRELTRVEGEMEQIQGRLKLLEETSAFALINVELEAKPADMPANAGPDLASSEGEPARFRASFVPPEEIEEFAYEWDFGDGSEKLFGTRTAPAPDGDSRVTATVTHAYGDERDSPFIVTFKITGTGKAGVAKGEDSLLISVTRLPNIEVFSGEDMTIEEGETVRLSGSLTRPEALGAVSYRWEFGDGSSPVSGTLGPGETTASASHVYPNARPAPFAATLTVTGTGDTGTVKGTDSLNVFVLESTGWSARDTAGGAVDVLGAAGRGLGRAGIWLGILSPFWVAGLVIASLVVWRRRRRPVP